MRLHAFLDPATAVEIGAEIRTKDPLHFVDSKPYPARMRLRKLRRTKQMRLS